MENRLSIALRKAQERPGFVNLIDTNFHSCGLFPDDTVIAEAYRAYLNDPLLRPYAPDPAGLPLLREAIASFYARSGITVEPAQVVVTASASESYHHVFTGICAQEATVPRATLPQATLPGASRDGSARPVVLLPRPGYPLFEDVAVRSGLEPWFYDLVPDEEWRINTGQTDALFERIVRDGARPAALVVISPNNPTGSVVDTPTFLRLGERCAAYGAALIVDEVFSEFRFGAAAAAPLPRALDLCPDVPVFTINGASKLLASPDLKVSWIVASGPDRADAVERLEIEADIYLNASPLNQYAASVLLRGDEGRTTAARRRTATGGPADAVVREVARRRAAMLDSLAELSRASPGLVSWVEPAGGIHLPLVLHPTPGDTHGNALSGLDDEELAIELLNRCGVAVHPGYLYGVEETTMLVLSYLSPEEVIREGIARMGDMFTGSRTS